MFYVLRFTTYDLREILFYHFYLLIQRWRLSRGLPSLSADETVQLLVEQCPVFSRRTAVSHGVKGRGQWTIFAPLLAAVRQMAAPSRRYAFAAIHGSGTRDTKTSGPPTPLPHPVIRRKSRRKATRTAPGRKPRLAKTHRRLPARARKTSPRAFARRRGDAGGATTRED